MPLQPYKSYELLFDFNGSTPVCLTGLVLGESTELINRISDSGWKRHDPNLQSFGILCEGIDQGAYALFKAAGKSPVPFQINTADLAIFESGQVMVQKLERTNLPDQDPKFSVTLIGYLRVITTNFASNYLLQEDLDLILQENGDRIII